MALRPTIKTILLGETLLYLVSLLALWLFPAQIIKSPLVMLPAYLTVGLLLHLPIALIKGWDFRLYDEHPESFWKYYWYFVLIVGIFLASWFAGVARQS